MGLSENTVFQTKKKPNQTELYIMFTIVFTIFKITFLNILLQCYKP